jgi:hypothetical protein
MIGSKYLIFVDEAGSPSGYDPDFPVFVLSFILINKQEYVNKLLPKFCELKLKYFNHTHIVFHERDIRKATGCFDILLNSDIRESFLKDMNKLINSIDFYMIGCAVNRNKYDDKNLYSFLAKNSLSALTCFLQKDSGLGYISSDTAKTPIIFESRGKKEDKTLLEELNKDCQSDFFDIMFSNKSSNGFGIQLADLTARPIGRFLINNKQKNRAYEVLKDKLFDLRIYSKKSGQDIS